MKTRTLLASLALVLGAPAFAAGDKHDHAHAHTPLHGGVVVEVKDIDYELVAKPTLIQLYLRDHGKPTDVATASARLTVLTGTGKYEIELKPAGDRLEATGAFKIGPGSTAVAVVSLPGKPPSTVRFAVK